MRSILQLFCIFLTLTTGLNAQTTYTWNGNTNSNWSEATNWSPNGVPGILDEIVINNALAPQSIVDANFEIARLNVTNGTLIIDNTLTVSGATANSIVSPASISGTSPLILTGATTFTATNATIDVALNITSGQITINGNTFQRPVVFTRTGNNGNASGGNTYNAVVTINNNASNNAAWQTGAGTADTYNAALNINNQGANNNAIIELARSSANTFNHPININISSGVVRIGTTQAASSVSIPASNLPNISGTGGTVEIRNWDEAFTNPINFNLGSPVNLTLANSNFGGAVAIVMNENANLRVETCSFNSTFSANLITGNINLGGAGLPCTFSGNVLINGGALTLRECSFDQTFESTITGTSNFISNLFNESFISTSGNIILRENTFENTATLVKNGGGNGDSPGGNIFNGVTTIIQSSGSARIRFSDAEGFPDVFASDLILETANSTLEIARRNTCSFNGNIFIKGLGGSISIGSTDPLQINEIGTGHTIQILDEFSSGTLTLRNLIVSEPLNLNASGSTNFVIQTSTFNGPVSLTSETGTATIGQFTTSNTFNETFSLVSGRISLRGNIFEREVSVTKNAAGDDDNNGGNLFKDIARYTTNATGNRLRLSSPLGNPDTYEDDLILTATNGGRIELATLQTTTFSGDIIVNRPSGNTPITIGNPDFPNELVAGKTLRIGAQGYTAGTLTINNFTFPEAVNLPLDATLNLAGNTFEDSFTTTGLGNITSTSVFNDVLIITREAGTTNLNDGTIVTGNTAITTSGPAATNATDAIFEGDFALNGTGNGASTFLNSTFAGLVTLENSAALTLNGSQFAQNVTISGLGAVTVNNNNTAAQNLTVNRTGTSNFVMASGATVTGDLAVILELGSTINIQNSTVEGTTNLTNGTGLATIGAVGNGNTFQGEFTGVFGRFVLTDNTFTGPCSLTKNSDGNDDSNGGNTFGSSTTINYNGSGRMRFANIADMPDNFNGTLEINHTGTGALELARVATGNIFNGNITVTSNNGGNINFGINGGESSFGAGLATGSNYNSGTLELRGVTQTSLTNVNISQTEVAAFVLRNSTLLANLSVINENGNITLENGDIDGTFIVNQSGNGQTNLTNININGSTTIENNNTITINNSQFTQEVSVMGTGNINTQNASLFSNNLSIVRDLGTITFTTNTRVLGNTNITTNGGGVINTTDSEFIGVFTLTNNGITTSALTTSTFGNLVTLENSAALTLNGSQFAQNVTISGLGAVTVNNNNTVAQNLTVNRIGASNFTMASGASVTGNLVVNLELGSTINIQNSIVEGTTNLTNGTGLATIGAVGNGNTFGGDFTGVFGRFILADNTFTGPCSLTKNSDGNDDSAGGNTFNGNLSIIHNATARIWLSNTEVDAYNQNLTLLNNSTGSISLRHLTPITIGGSLTVGSTGTGTINVGERSSTTINASNDLVISPSFNTGILTLNNLVAINPSPKIIDIDGTLNLTGATFFNSDLNVSAGVVNLQSITVNGNLTVSRKNNIALNGTGPVTITGNLTLNIPNAAAFTIANGNNLAVGGNINVSGSVAGAVINLGIGAAGKLVFTGGANQIFTSSNNFSPVANIEVNKSGGIVSLTGGNIEIPNNLNFINGYITTNTISSAENQKLIIRNNATATGASDASHVIGFIEKIGNQAFDFPVGNGSFYRPIRISNPSVTTARFTACYFSADPSAVFGDDFDFNSFHNFSQQEYWILDRVASTNNVFVTLSWNENTSTGINDIDQLIVVRFNGSSWINTGGANRTGDVIEGTVTTTAAVTQFSPFTLASLTSANPLPVELLHFGATALNREKVLVNWSTAAEINNNYFLVERSHNARDFELVNQVWGAGFSNTTLQYSITDEPRTETNTLFYRLIQVDFDGTETIYGPVAVNFEGENSLTIFQAKGTIMLQYSGLESSDMQFNLVDMQGRLIQSSRQVVESGVQPLQHKPLPKGMYVVNAFNNRTQYSFKVVVP